jgi:hypothetical protein
MGAARSDDFYLRQARSWCGWIYAGPGRWQRGREVILKRSSGVWYWYPDGLSGKRAVGPFMTRKGARLRALRGRGTRIRGSEDRRIATKTASHRQ